MTGNEIPMFGGKYEHDVPFDDMNVFMSIASVGGLRKVVKSDGAPSPRIVAAGNMNPRYEINSDAYEAERRANANISHFMESIGYDSKNLVIMRPTNPARNVENPEVEWHKLGIQNLDAIFTPGESGSDATWLAKEMAGDFIYTREPNIILGCRPADCPVLVFKGTDNEGRDLLAMLHAGWQNLNASHLEQAIDFLCDQGLSHKDMEVYISPCAAKESFPYANEVQPGAPGSRFDHASQDQLAVDVVYDSEAGIYRWNIDMMNFIDHTLAELEVEKIYHDGSDTARLDSGYSSHSRAMRRQTGEQNTRDIIVSSLGEPNQAIMINRTLT